MRHVTQNISVTAHTSWRATYRSHSPCYINITHTAGAYSAAELAAATRNRVLVRHVDGSARAAAVRRPYNTVTSAACHPQVSSLSVRVDDIASRLHDFARLWVHSAKYRDASLAAFDELRCERESYQRVCENEYAALGDVYRDTPLLCTHAFNVTARSAAERALNGSLPYFLPSKYCTV